MEIKVNFLDNLRLEAKFDDFTVIADQPIRYKGDGSAPGPFDYFLASSALCAAYFVKLYCSTRNIPTENIRLSQNNIVDPENRYNQIFKIQVELPADISDKDRQGILRSIDRCTVKKVVQAGPEFVIEEVDNLDADAQALLMPNSSADASTFIVGKDLPLEQTIANMSGILADLGMKIEIASWRNIVPNVWSLHIRDAHSPMCFTNGKGATKEGALASALGEFIERLNCNFFYNDQFWGEDIANAAFVHYPDERWFQPGRKDELPPEILDPHCLKIYNRDGELRGSHLFDTNSGNEERGIVSLPFVRQSDGEVVYFPSNLIENLFLSNGMSAGNTLAEAQVQCLSEIFERAVKREIIEGEFALPDVPQEVLAKYPAILAGIQGLEEQGFPVLVKDASLGGEFPGDVRDPDEPAYWWCIRLVRRAPEPGSGAGAQPHRIASGPQFRGLERSAAADLRRPRGDRAEQLRRALHRLQRRGLVALLQCPVGLRVRRVGLHQRRRRLQRRRSRDPVQDSRRHGQAGVHGGV